VAHGGQQLAFWNAHHDALRQRQGRRVGREDQTVTIWESQATTSWV